MSVISTKLESIQNAFEATFALLEKRTSAFEGEAITARSMQLCINQILQSPEYKKLKKLNLKLRAKI
jgi:hypothetical protein